jgi:hypothetical protein
MNADLLAGLVAWVDGPASAVDRLWLAIARKHGVHLRRDTGLSYESFLREAFETAGRRGFLQALVRDLLSNDLLAEDPPKSITSEDLARLVGPVYQPQAAVHPTQRAKSAAPFAIGMTQAFDYMCRIDIDGRHRGTGLYVAPGLVVTAAHVLKKLFRRKRKSDGFQLTPDGSLIAEAGTVQRITVTFGDIDLPNGPSMQRQAGTPVELHEDWLFWGSPPAACEWPVRLGDVDDIRGIVHPEGPWDLAVIRLAFPLRMWRFPALNRQPPEPEFTVNVLHHMAGTQTNGLPLMRSEGVLNGRLGDPALRYLHNATTGQGSSGGAIFDEDWRVVAIHQGTGTLPQSSGGAARVTGTDTARRNRAVPVRHWCEAAARLGPAPDSFPVMRMLNTATGEGPVIGRRETQRRLWRAMYPRATAADRLLIVRGRPGMGRRFTTRLVEEYVSGDGAIVMTLDLANALQDDARGFAQRLAAAASVPPPEIRTDRFNTDTRLIRDQILPAMGATWQADARNRPRWIILEGFAGAPIDVPASVRTLVENLIVQQLPQQPNLRIVAVGWLETAPRGFEYSIEDLAPPTAQDIVDWLFPAGTPQPDGLFNTVAAELRAEAEHGDSEYATAVRVLGNWERRLAERIR